MDLIRNRDGKTGELSHNEHSELNIRYIVNAYIIMTKMIFLMMTSNQFLAAAVVTETADLSG